jgi:hypothetical protein
MKGALEAERDAQGQRLNAARWVQIDESKAPSASDLMLLHRIRAAAAERSDAFDRMLRDRDANRLFNAGAWYFRA